MFLSENCMKVSEMYSCAVENRNNYPLEAKGLACVMLIMTKNIFEQSYTIISACWKSTRDHWVHGAEIYKYLFQCAQNQIL